MATPEEVGVSFELNSESFRLVRNMRRNASAYLQRVTAPARPQDAPGPLGVEMKEDATAFKVRLQRITDLVARNQALVQNALAVFGQTLAQANALKTQLTDTANHVLAATLTTPQQISDEANFILANTPSYDGMF